MSFESKRDRNHSPLLWHMRALPSPPYLSTSKGLEGSPVKSRTSIKNSATNVLQCAHEHISQNYDKNRRNNHWHLGIFSISWTSSFKYPISIRDKGSKLERRGNTATWGYMSDTKKRGKWNHSDRKKSRLPKERERRSIIDSWTWTSTTPYVNPME